MRRLVTVTLVVGLVVGSVLLAGCQSDDDPDPKVSPTESSSATSTPTPTGPVEPTLPAEAEGDDAAAAEAFVEHFWSMVNYAQVSGDTAGLTSLGAPNCVACKGGVEEIERVHGAGGSMEGGELVITRSIARPFDSGPASGFAVALDVEVSPQTVAVPGDETQEYSGGPGKIQVIVEQVDGAWTVQRWDSL